jgi:hypothetical protein
MSAPAHLIAQPPGERAQRDRAEPEALPTATPTAIEPMSSWSST